jgi:hypothetical protein
LRTPDAARQGGDPVWKGVRVFTPWSARAAAALVVTVTALAGCSVEDGSVPPAPPPPPPPAACLLDTVAFAAATGLSWSPDPSTASDTRCVYDPSGTPRPPEGPAFLAVDVAPDPDPVALETVAALCEDGSRSLAGTAGFVCRFQGGNVFAAVAREGHLVTLAASAVPTGTTAARLVVAFDQQVAALGR